MRSVKVKLICFKAYCVVLFHHVVSEIVIPNLNDVNTKPLQINPTQQSDCNKTDSYIVEDISERFRLYFQ